ncbi:hypothetical protein Ahy_A03g016631 [Arachis hypogaea]|uniref:Transmembrane protein n=1 Tax=Arachis hypogaea TaxID=3818 RepID=A0A445E406_ARAHY|nr:hypothetical protein Ahy_A03g016631 [Arachis hypogaea]
MAIFNNGLAYTIVIVVLISPEITTQVVSPPPDSPPGNVSEPIRPKDNTVRVDPYDNFKKYRGGFNITNKHYWSSVVFTGVYGYAVGVLWLLCGILCGLFFLIINCCCQSFGGNKGCDLLPIPLAILLLIIAMAASGLVLAGSAKFRCHASSSVNVVINTADKASGIIFNITGALKGIPTELVDADIASKLNTTSQRFDTAAQNITQEAAKNRHIINMALKALFIFSIVTVSLNLVFVISMSDAICGKEKFIPGSEYEVIKEYTSSVQNLLDVYPSIESLLGCQLVKDAFSQVLQKHCKPLKRFSKVTWAAMVSLAATMVLLVVLWTMKANYHEHSHQP